MNQRDTLHKTGWSRPRPVELAEWGDTSQVRFGLWALITMLTTAVVTLTLFLFQASRHRQKKMRRQRAQKRRFQRDLRRWHKRRERYEKEQQRQLEKTLRAERREQERLVRAELVQKQ